MASRSPPDGYERRLTILADHFADRTTSKDAAERLASLTLEEKPETGLNMTWGSIITIARESGHHLEKLANVLVEMTKLPPAKDENGEQLMLYGLRIWGMDLPTELSARQKAINNFTNINKLAALLTRSGATLFSSFDLFAIWTMRSALETPAYKDLDAFIPAAAAWITVLGSEMYSWDREFPYGDKHGDPGKGGELWEGQYGPCRERWQFWRRRFGDLSMSDRLTNDLRGIAKDAEAQMAAIEADTR